MRGEERGEKEGGREKKSSRAINLDRALKETADRGNRSDEAPH